MDDQADHLQALMELETRHEDLLGQLDELDKRVECVLRACQPARAAGDSDGLICGCPDVPTS